MRQHVARPGRVIQRQVSREALTLRARQQQIIELRKLSSPAIPRTGVAPAGLTPREALAQRLIDRQQPAEVRSFDRELGLLTDQSPEVLGTSDGFLLTEAYEKIPFTLEYTRVFQVRPDTRARALEAEPMDRVVAALSGTPLLSDAQYNERNAIYQERYEALKTRFAEEGFEPVSVGVGQVRFIRADSPTILDQPYCSLDLGLPQHVQLEGTMDSQRYDVPFQRSGEGSFIPVLNLPEAAQGCSGGPISGGSISGGMVPHTSARMSGLPQEDPAAAVLRRGNADLAVDMLEERVAANPADARSLRLLGMAQLVKGETAAGMRLIDEAYRLDPGLADVPADVHAFPGDRRGCRKALVEIVKLGHALDDPRAWLSAAVLMQAEGRTRPAKRMIDRARAGGLEADIADAMDAALMPTRH